MCALFSDMPVNCILQGNCIEILQQMPEKSADMIFADPPYNLQLKQDLYRPNQSKVAGVFDQWDKFDNFAQYDHFTEEWLRACQRVLKDNGTIWVIGSYHNIYRVGAILQNLGFWLLNDVVWIKTNPMPNFKGTRFNNAHETLLWAAKSEQSRYTFHYKALKTYNEDLQMRSDWYLPICSGEERLKTDGQKAHSTQKPLALLYRILLSASNVGDLIIDPFSGSGTTAAVAKLLGRQYIGIEQEETYVRLARERLAAIEPLEAHLLQYLVEQKPPKVPFGNLVAAGLVRVGECLYDKNRQHKALVLADSSLQAGEWVGSIHKVSAALLQKPANNGWLYWFVEREGRLVCIDDLRRMYAEEF